MHKHLTLDDRMEIQMGLKAGENFTTIARRIDSNRTTVSREVKARRIPVHNSRGNRWNTMRNWHSRITKLSVPNRAEGSELTYLDSVISPEIKRGQSVHFVWENHKAEMPVSDRTLYTYIDRGLLDAGNCDLRRKLRMPKRKKSGPVLRVDKRCHIGRTYEDYQNYISRHHEAVISQMDSVIGRKGGKVLLTILFKNCDLQLMYIRERNTAASVSAIFQALKKQLGMDRFTSLFQVILTDRGSEFTDPVNIECDQETGEIQCRVFYCDPMNSNQKSNCERNHEFIRYVIPKGTSMDHFSQTDIMKLMNHINSYPRKKWNGQTPLDLFTQIYGQETTTLLGLEKIPSNSIDLTPALLKK